MAFTSPSRTVVIALIVSVSGFMQMLDSTIISTALPQMSLTFQVSPIALNIGITAYILTAAAFMPVSGWAADTFGTRDTFRAAIAVFTIGSIFCGFSTGLWEFTFSRVLQGIGGAVMFPVGQMVALRGADKAQLIRAVNLVSAPSLIAPVIGPPLGGFITTYFSWHWIFFLNLPIGLLGLILVTIFVENHRAPEKRPLDIVGFGVTATALACLMYALELAGNTPFDWVATAILLVVGAGLAGFAVRHALRHPHPMLNLAPLKIKTYAASMRGNSIFRGVMGAWSYLMPLMLQIGFGMSAFTAGLLILGNATGDVSMKFFTRRLLRRFGFKTVLLGNGLLTAVMIFTNCLLFPSTPYAVVVPVLLANGLIRSLQFTGFNTLQYAEITPAAMSAATTLTGAVAQLCMGSGVAIAAILMEASLSYRGVTTGNPDVVAFHFAFFVAAICMVICALLYVNLPPRSGEEVSGHHAGTPANEPEPGPIPVTE